MEVLLVHFREETGVRRFSFDCVGSDRSRTKVIVSADVALARKYNIQLQELPLLCRRLIENASEGMLEPYITLTESHMVAIQSAARVVSEKRRHKPVRPSAATGRSWRTTPPSFSRDGSPPPSTIVNR